MAIMRDIWVEIASCSCEVLSLLILCVVSPQVNSALHLNTQKFRSDVFPKEEAVAQAASTRLRPLA